MSLGHHWGAHDGTEVEERLHETLVGKGKVIVISAGNERNDPIHLGSRFAPGGLETVGFRILRQPPFDPPFAAITLWYDAQDDFDVTLTTPSGESLQVPALGNIDQFSSSQIDLELGRAAHPGPSPAVKVQLLIACRNAAVPNSLLNNWKLRIGCSTAVVGRIDGWFNNSGFGEFLPHPIVEQARTLGLPASGAGCLAVASHVSKNAWTADNGSETDASVVVGRSSPFSSLGPTRDDRQKPDLSAPGQYITAALAESSELASISERALTSDRVLTIEGTSMAAPIVTGAVALLLQKKPTLTSDAIRNLLKGTARTDVHTGSVWNPAYGQGKINIVKALSEA